jgi:four helix bundle protein
MFNDSNMNDLSRISSTIEWKRSMDLAISMHQVTRQMMSDKPDKSDKSGSDSLAERLIQAVFKVESRITESYHSWVFTQSELLCMARYHLSETEFYLECAYRQRSITHQDYCRLQSDISYVRFLLNARIENLQKKKPLLLN